MNVLIDVLPEAVEVDGKVYDVNFDFRECLRVILAFEDNSLAHTEKLGIALALMYEDIPANVEEALLQAIKFLDGGEIKEVKSEEEKEIQRRYFSFKKDAGFIFAAFRQTHGIDLSTARLHWWAFIALLMDLGADTTFCQLVSLRKRVKTGKASKEERKMARELGNIFELEEVDTRTFEEREKELEFMRLVNGESPVEESNEALQ